MKLSVIILTHNRVEELRRTLRRVEAHTSSLGLGSETWVVDNGSTDDTAGQVRRHHQTVRLIHLATNEGVWARQYALDEARGQYVCFVDDDSYPIGNALARSLQFLDEHPRVAAVTGCVVLPDGTREASALPAVPAIGALCARRTALQEAGGLRPCREFVRQAEEYDLAFRLLARGHRLVRFEDVLFRHRKWPGARSTDLVHRLDMRNNLIVLDRYVPEPLCSAYRDDWIQRYTALAAAAGHQDAADQGRIEADRWTGRRDGNEMPPADDAAIETIFRLDDQSRRVSQWSGRHRIKRVCIADFGKNIYATHRACRLAGLDITAIADPHPAFRGRAYRGIPIKDDADALPGADGVVLSTINPAQVDRRHNQLRRLFAGHVLRLWTGQTLGDALARSTAARS